MSEFRHQAMLEKIDLAALQEPPTLRGRVTGVEPMDRVISSPGERLANAPESAILVLNHDLAVTSRPDLGTKLIVVGNIEAPGVNFDIISVYAKFSTPLADVLTELEGVLRKVSRNVILVGDFNAHSVLWGDRRTDNKGVMLEDFSARNGLTILNDPTSQHTFVGHPGQSHIDVSMASQYMAEVDI